MRLDESFPTVPWLALHGSQLRPVAAILSQLHPPPGPHARPGGQLPLAQTPRPKASCGGQLGCKARLIQQAADAGRPLQASAPRFGAPIAPRPIHKAPSKVYGRRDGVRGGCPAGWPWGPPGGAPQPIQGCASAISVPHRLALRALTARPRRGHAPLSWPRQPRVFSAPRASCAARLRGPLRDT